MLWNIEVWSEAVVCLIGVATIWISYSGIAHNILRRVKC